MRGKSRAARDDCVEQGSKVDKRKRSSRGQQGKVVDSTNYHRTDLEEVEPITLLCCEEQKALQATEEIYTTYKVPRR
jgi:hypothetical protein